MLDAKAVSFSNSGRSQPLWQMKRTSSRKFFQPSVVAALAIAIVSGLSVSAAQAGYILTLQEVGSDVMATGSGTLDLTGLSFISLSVQSAGMFPAHGFIATGSSGPVSIYTGFTGAPSFGSGSFTAASSSSGDLVGISNAAGELIVPQGYLGLGFPLSDSATYTGATFASLGVTPGTYEWTWGTGTNQNFTLDAVAPAVPDSGSTFGLLLVALGALFGVSRFSSLRLA